MSTPYRTDLDALRETKATLERELAGTKTREKELETELASVEQRIRAKTRLPVLDDVRVASPCHASWDEMLGDDRVRFCTSCEKNVFNLSAMSREEAEQLVAERTNGELCVRFYQRADGTIMTQDCPVGVSKKRRKVAVLAAAGAGAMALAVTSFAPRTTMGVVSGPVRMGEMAAFDPEATVVTAPQPTTERPHHVEDATTVKPPTRMGRTVRPTAKPSDR